MKTYILSVSNDQARHQKREEAKDGAPNGADAITTNGDLAMAAGEVGIRSGGPPRPAQGPPANQRAPEREERLVDVGPFVIPHAQAAKLTEPGKCALHDPPPPAEATPVRGTAHGQPGHDVTSPETAPYGG